MYKILDLAPEALSRIAMDSTEKNKLHKNLKMKK